MAAALAMPIVVSSTASAHENSLVNKEIARRELQIVEADKAILVGRKAYADRDYEEAVNQYRKAVTMLPQGPIAADRRRAYVGHLLDGPGQTDVVDIGQRAEPCEHVGARCAKIEAIDVWVCIERLITF